MNKIFSLFTCLFLTVGAHSQIHELGVFLGGSNYVGDVGSTTYIAPNEPAIGLLYKWNKSPRHSWRVSYTQTKLAADDFDSKEPGRNQRGYRFENNVKEVSLGLEFNFFEFNLHELGHKITPYVFGGVSYFRYDQLYVLSGLTQEDEKANAFAIPVTIGIKSSITPRLILAAEIGVRATLTDNIDGSNPTIENRKPLRFGNLNNNDWYVFSGVTLTYTFGQKPCYCAD
ncbi:DUF6089 family protein [Flavobacterium sp.]|uniref:type IX secretion system protein PorG n=1 Tax=Flavobacterium sp. TaxID=239 RepID=UPI002601E2A8|nr:DUF6089 family protein [Flavobacterium sp.]MDG2430950.1 DUF6089 family protein [Flavobacterium sp.]